MISHLFIKNIALITELSIDLENGFNVLSGETGAGKSIIVDSVNLILGKRADKDLIRAGQETARVEALIETGNKELLKECLEAYGIEGDELIISRELSQSGKNVCRINGQLSSLTQLRDIVSRFIDICGQNDNIMLLDEKYHMTLVDEFGGEEISLLKEKAAEAYEEYHRLSRELKELQKGVEDKERLTDLYRYQIDEISGANVKPGEDDELTEERDMMLNAEKLAKHLYEAKENISGNKGTLETLYEALENI
ncbi:MAG: AAA family ATPase, partial [Clostridia bacterium]|nr:AAA family ATPase [Clostridia bacterium]